MLVELPQVDGVVGKVKQIPKIDEKDTFIYCPIVGVCHIFLHEGDVYD